MLGPMSAEAAPDVQFVRYAFRLGWGIAELRGRFRPDRFGDREPGTPVFKKEVYELPLANERSPTEIRRELIDTVEDLGKALGLHEQPDLHTRWTELKTLLKGMEERGADHQALWNGVAHKFYDWDACAQDTLVLEATHAAAYQLGRGLAETYWALESDRAEHEMGSWAFLLGPHRCDTMRRLASRLSLEAPIIAAIEGPLESWSKLAADATSRAEPNVDTELYKQGLLWRDLIRGERQPRDLQATSDLKTPASAEVWKDLKLYRVALENLKMPLAGGIISIAALVAGATLLASGSGHTGRTSAISILGALGLTSAGLYARAKASATSLLANLRQRVQVARVRQAANLCPGSKDTHHRRRLTLGATAKR